MPPAADSSVPPRIADYELLKLIGTGSYGDVWLARGVTSVFCAVKVVWRARFSDVRPYEREFEGVTRFAAISLREPSQLALLHAGRSPDAGYFFYVMELADDAVHGREIEPERYVPLTLREMHRRRGRLPVEEVLAIGVALARALATLHAAGLVHRDIKPSNVVFVGGVPKLADVGLVAAASEGLTFVGTEGYVPREGPGAPAADVYGLGKVLYEVATGLDRHDWPRLPPNLAEIPDRRALLELNEVLVRACEADARSRFADAGALLEELLLLQAGKSVRRLRAAERRTTRALRIAAVLAVVAGVAGTGAWVERQRANKELALREQAESVRRKVEAERDELARRSAYSGNLASAQSALGIGDLGRARRLLQEVEPKPGETDLRGFEWRALWHEATGDPREEIRAAGHEIRRIELSPDQSVLAVHDQSETLTLYDTVTLREVFHAPGVWKFAGFSTDGNWLVGADRASTTMRWSARDGQLDPSSRATIGLPIGAVGPAGVVAISDSPPARLQVWSFAERRELANIAFDAAPLDPPWTGFLSDISPDRRVLVRAWVRGTDSNARFRLTCVQLSPDQPPSIQQREFGAARPSAVGADQRGAWAFFEPETDDAPGEVWRCGARGWEKSGEILPKRTRKLADVDYHGQPARLVARDRELIWLVAGQPVTRNPSARGHGANLNDFAIATKHGRIFSAAADGSLFCWPLDPPAPKTYRAWNSNAGATRAVFTQDSQAIWVPSDGESCVLLDVKTLALLGRAHDMRYPLALADDSLIGVAAKRGLVRVNSRTGDSLGQIIASNVPTRIAAASRDGREIAAIDQAGDLIATGRDESRHMAHDLDRIFVMALDQTGKRLWTTRQSREMLCVSWPDNRLLWKQTLSAVAPSFLLLPDQERLVVALSNGTLEVRNANTGEILLQPVPFTRELRKKIDAGTGAPQALAVTPDGRRLFVGTLEGDIHCFDTASWQETHAIPLGPEERVHRLDCSPDGKTLAALTKTGTLHLVRTE